jgi:hypothetical protein
MTKNKVKEEYVMKQVVIWWQNVPAERELNYNGVIFQKAGLLMVIRISKFLFMPFVLECESP